MVDTTPFISRDDLGKFLRRDLTDDDLGIIAVDSACDELRRLTGQTFNEGETTVSLDGSGTRSLVLPQTPVTDVTSVLVAGEEIDAADYVVTDGAVLRRVKIDGDDVNPWCYGWPRGAMNVEVTYSHGFAEVPRDLRMLALTLAGRIYEQGIVRQESVGGAETSFSVAAALDLSRTEQLIVRKYRRTKPAAVSQEVGS